MATAAPSSLECSICSEYFEKPKILDCLHSFCEKCLYDYQDKTHAGLSEIPCPLCRQTIRVPVEGIEGLRTNFHLGSVIDEIRKMILITDKTNICCEMCTEGKTAQHRCIECIQNICPSCQESHLLIASCSSHTIVSVEDISQGKVRIKRAEPLCPQHEGEVMRFYCETCQQMICRDCTVVDHSKPDHKCIDSKVASRKCKRSLNDAFPVLVAIIDEHKKELVDVAEAKQEFKANVIRAVGEIKETAAAVVAKVKADETRLIDEIETLEQDRSLVFSEREKTVDGMLQRKQHSLETAQDVTNTAADSDLLSLYPILSNDLTSLTRSPNRLSSNHALSHLKFIQRWNLVEDTNLGELERVGKIKWELDFEFSKENSGFNLAADVDFLSEEEIAVSDFKQNQVVIISTTGTRKRIIQTATGPRAVAAMNDQIVVVDNTHHVKVYNKEGMLANQFIIRPSGNLRGLVLKNNIIILGDIQRKVLIELSPGDHSLIRTIPVKTPPHYLAVDSHDRVVIGGGDEAVVEVVDGNGTTQFTIKPTIKDHGVHLCTGVCCDCTHIYVAIAPLFAFGAHIHCYDYEGKFHSCVVQGLQNPSGIKLSPDNHRMAVADGHSVKVYHKV